MTISTTSPGAPSSPVAPVPEPTTPILSAPLRNSFDYTRSLGPVLSQFALALRDGRILGSKASDGTVSVPPREFDQATGRATEDLVEVASVGTVTSWSVDGDRTWALIKLDGADTALLHNISANSVDEMVTGMRVHAVWRAARTGRIDDILAFAPGDSPERASADENEPFADGAPVIITTPITTEIIHSASEAESAYLAALKQGTLLGTRIGSGVDAGRVYFPPRSTSPADGAPATEEVELPDTGTVTTFCVVNVPFLGQQIKPPYVAAYVLLDGADIPFLHLILDVAAEEVRMGMRVQAVWAPESEWGHSIGNISHFRPSGEPDADYDTYKDHL